MKKLLGLFWLGLLIVGCSGDDGLDGEIIPPRLLSEVAPENDAEIMEYLQTHFYNYEEFDAPPVDFDYKIRMDTIAGENSGKTPLSEQVERAVINISDFQFGLDDGEEDIPHTLYYLMAREGVGPSPSIADSVFLRYTGKLLDGTTFDASDTGVWFDLARLQAPQQGARGFTEGTAFFNSGSTPIVYPDGTFDVEGFSIGAIFMPSGLGFFNNIQSLIPEYSPLIFEIDVMAMADADHDQDGIPSIMEDLNGNGYLYDDNTDEEEEEENGLILAVNFLDIDDDGDGTLTIDEIIIDEDGNIIFPDADGDMLPDYLDPDTPEDDD